MAKGSVKSRPVLEERLTIDGFMTLFLAALVLRGKRYIHVRGTEAPAETRRIYALEKYLDQRCREERKDKDRQHFLLKLCCELAPGPNGFCDGFKHQVLSKMLTFVSVDLVYADYYQLDLQQVTARSYLEQASTFMRELAEGSAAVYLGLEPR